MITTATVATKTAALQASQDAWELVADLLGGTAAMRAAGHRRLPQWPAESDESYKARLATATLFPAFARTVEVMTGKPTSKPPVVGKDVGPEVKKLLPSMDQQGNTLAQFSALMMDRALSYGFGVVFVDFPQAPPAAPAQTPSKAEEQARGARPYCVLVAAQSVIGWRARQSGTTWELEEFRFEEYVTEPDGEWGERQVRQVRVLRPGSWEVHRMAQSASPRVAVGDWVVHDKGLMTLQRVPVVPFYGHNRGFMLGAPPMIDLAYLNVKHWQSQSDQDTLLHVARVPILTAVVDDETWQLEVGSAKAVRMPPGSTLSFTEHSGAAIGAGKVSLDDLKEEMRQTGAELLVLKPGLVTATQVGSEDEASRCALQRITQSVEDSLNAVIAMMADWINQIAPPAAVELHKEFGVATLAEASAQLLVMMAAAGQISNATLLAEMKRRGIVSDQVTWELEQDLLSAQGPPLGADTMGGGGGGGFGGG